MKKLLAIFLLVAMLLSTTSMCVFADDTTTTEPVVETVTVPVSITGEYEGVNHWANATYTFDVTDGVAATNGWISNGEYKFKYSPADGKIKSPTEGSSFNLEEGKGIPAVIVIPYTIAAFNTDYATYDAKTIVMSSTNNNYAIFKGNSYANTKIVVPEGTTAIGASIFAQTNKNNKNLEVVLPSTITSVGKSSFAQTTSGGMYKEIILPEGLKTIGQAAFSQCRFSNFVIPSTVESISQQAFAFMTNLKTITFKSTFPSLGNETFRKCNKLESITFEGDTAPTISSGAFKDVTVTTLKVYYKANGTGYTDPEWQALFPAGTTFEKLPGDPIVEEISMTGKTVIGGTLTANYTFVDPLGREESGSTATWESCESEDFTSSEVFPIKTEPCSSGVPVTYVMQELDDGKYIRCTVTPRNADTTLNVGAPVSVQTETLVKFPETVPAVTLTAPSNGYYVSVNSAVTLSADATCDLTTITKVEFYVNDVKVGEDTTAPYEYSWTPSEMGAAVIYAKAYNALDEEGVSSTASVNVLAEGADLSSYITTTFTAPIANSVHLSNGAVTFTGTTSESSGSEISKVELFANAKSIGTATITPPAEGETAYGFTLATTLDAGAYSIIAIVESADGKSGTSEAFDILVSGMSFPTMIADNMVLQRGKNMKISGFGVDGTVVTASLLDKTASATVAGGKWTVNFPPMPTTKSTTLTFTASDGTEKVFNNIAIGEVIMCSGQSNMTMGMGNSHTDYRDKDYADIRLFVTPNNNATSATENDDIAKGQWKIATKGNAKEFSMVGWIAGQQLYNNTNGEFPIGLIWAAESGTAIQYWVPSGTYSHDPDLKKISKTGSRYNARVAPWTGFTVGHLIWYQGESNSFHEQNYEKDMTAFIDAYRNAFDDQSMKFVVICLPTYDAKASYNPGTFRSFNLVREGQYNVSLHMDGVASIVTIDSGSTSTVHPGDKVNLSKRTAKALQHFIDPTADIVWKSPSYDYMEVKDGKAILYFKDIAGGLSTKDGLSPKGFKLMDNDGIFNDVEATLVGNTVEIDVSAITGDVKIRYAYEEVPARVDTKSGVNLVNSEGWPMAPFRTDNDRTHFKSYDSATGIYSNPYNFAPMVRSITATDIVEGVAQISINARDYDDSIQSVEVFVDGTSVGSAIQAAYDTWTYDWANATDGFHQIHVIATDELGTTNALGHSTLGSVAVTPVKYGVTLKTAIPSLFGKFTNLTDGEIANFGGADGVKITTTGEGKLILAAYNDNKLVNCVITDEKSASLTAKDIEGATTVKAFLFEDMQTLVPVAVPISINR